jgi:hypothetical protein
VPSSWRDVNFGANFHGAMWTYVLSFMARFEKPRCYHSWHDVKLGPIIHGAMWTTAL